MIPSSSFSEGAVSLLRSCPGQGQRLLDMCHMCPPGVTLPRVGVEGTPLESLFGCPTVAFSGLIRFVCFAQSLLWVVTRACKGHFLFSSRDVRRQEMALYDFSSR